MSEWRAWLIYREAELELNRFSIETIRRVVESKGVALEVFALEELCLEGIYERYSLWQVQSAPIQSRTIRLRKGGEVELPHFCLNRSRSLALAQVLEFLGVPVFNNSHVCELGNHKAYAYDFFSAQGVPCLPYGYVRDAQALKAVYQGLPEGEKVLKTVDGHGGQEVFSIKSLEEALHYVERMEGRVFVLQTMASERGRDLRVYLLGNQILAAVLRQSDRDFRSNFSLGGRIEACEQVPEEIQSYLKQMSDLVSMDYVGIDFIFHEGRAYFNEVEDVVGARMLYDLGICDSLALYAAHCLRRMRID